jgi:hypothetical protein
MDATSSTAGDRETVARLRLQREKTQKKATGPFQSIGGFPIMRSPLCRLLLPLAVLSLALVLAPCAFADHNPGCGNLDLTLSCSRYFWAATLVWLACGPNRFEGSTTNSASPPKLRVVGTSWL